MKYLFFITAVAATLMATPSAFSESPPSWSLKDHYTLTSSAGALEYDVVAGEWRLVDLTGNCAISGVGFSFVLDGRTLTQRELKHVSSSREANQTPAGAGTLFLTEFQTPDGVGVLHKMTLLKERPFMLFELEVGNLKSSPINISEVSPIVLNTTGLSETQVEPVSSRTRGACLMPDAPSGLRVLQTAGITLAFGTLPSTLCDTDVVGGSQIVQCRSAFVPAASASPGERISSAQAWFCYRISDAQDIRRQFAWSTSLYERPTRGPCATPSCWATLPKGSTAKDLSDLAKTWISAKSGGGDTVYHVTNLLVPADWSTETAFSRGRGPDYPEDMKKLADDLRAMGMTPGLGINPFVRGNVSEEAKDNADWLDPTSPGGREGLITLLKPLSEWNYAFVVLEPCSIPDEALIRFRTTRRQVETAAYHIAAQVFGGSACVLPSSVRIASVESASATKTTAEYGVLPCPVQLDVTNDFPVIEQIIKAYPGPLEFLGKPEPALVAKLRDLLPGRFPMPKEMPPQTVSAEKQTP